MSRLPKDFWIRPLSIGIALSVPSIVVAATVTFSPTTVLDVATMSALSRRTLDKDRIYAATGGANVAVADGAAATATASCADAADIMLTCGCFGDGSTRQVVHNVAPSGNDNRGTGVSTCRCDVVSSGAPSTSAVATCIRIGRP